MTTNGSLSGRTIVISGGSRGIGLAIALKAAADGANLVLLAKTDQPHPKLEGTIHTAVQQIEEAGGTALGVVGDVRDDADIARAIDGAVATFGGVDAVVNNASVIDLSRTLELQPKKYDLMADVNVRGTFMLSRAAIPHLLQAGNPHILSLAPPLNLSPKWLGAHTGYTMAKYGMTMATLGIAAEFDGIAANTLWPRTTIATAAVRNLLGGDKVMALSRTPELYADAAYEVLTTDAATLTGQTLICEDVLEAAGTTDLARYAAVPGTPESALFPDIFL